MTGHSASQAGTSGQRHSEEVFVFPTSFAQERLWFLDQLEPDNPAYNVPAAVRLTGQLDIEALRRSLNEIVRRHETLRTTFTSVEGRPVQVISSPRLISVPVIDLEALPARERPRAVERLARDEAQHPFALDRGPLLRVQLLRLGPEEHVLLWTTHHIVSDAWSHRVVVDELTSLYSAFAAGRPPSLPEPTIQYVDFAAWQRNWLRGEVLAQQLTYWKQQLAGAPPVLVLPTDHPRPTVKTFRGATHAFALSQSLSDALDTLSRHEGVTLFMTLLAAFKAFLVRYTGQTDLVVGTPIANRTRRELEGLIGFFVNTLALRTDCAGDPPFRELLARVREVTLGAYAHQDLPFEQLVEALKPVRDLSHTPIVQILFVFQNIPPAPLTLPGVTLEALEVPPGTAKFDLTLSCLETAQGLRGLWEYNTDLFDAPTIQRMASHFETFLEGLLAHPEGRLSELPLLAEAERRQLLVEWNATQAAYPQDVCLHELVEAQVARTPAAVAVVCEDQALTYEELNRRANQLAHHLQHLGVGPEVCVGVCLERSVELLVALLAILKAGGAYVPLDTRYPKDRLAFLLDDARVLVLLTQQSLLPTLPKTSVPVICLDTAGDILSRESPENPCSPVSPANLAYIIYTSGSTGKPKGVAVEHRGLCNLARAQIQTFDIQPESRILQFAALTYDASISEIIMALCAGATLYLATQETLLPGPGLIDWLRTQAITTLTIPPSALAMLPTAELTALRTLIVAGEACPAELVTRWAQGRQFFNAYGPTETTVCATVAECVGGDHKPTIGRPIVNTQLYVLDSPLAPVPIGVTGELYIGGLGLARGYLHQPGLTAASFLSDPFGPQPGGRLYRTGDLVRYRADGVLEFLGRRDTQVKVRG